MSPAISILMANFNKGEFIQQAIESVLGQTYKNWELVIVDDASTDNSVEVIKKFLSYSRITFYQNKYNQQCFCLQLEHFC